HISSRARTHVCCRALSNLTFSKKRLCRQSARCGALTLQTLGNACAAHSGQRHWAAVGKRDRERLLVGIAPFVIAIGEDKTAASGPPARALKVE
ncbi:MAG TPA: hypothetical protein VIH63_00400, partial [Xanthobacteraceae bacterium]